MYTEIQNQSKSSLERTIQDDGADSVQQRRGKRRTKGNEIKRKAIIDINAI
jgi:hypothetical protein